MSTHHSSAQTASADQAVTKRINVQMVNLFTFVKGRIQCNIAHRMDSSKLEQDTRNLILRRFANSVYRKTMYITGKKTCWKSVFRIFLLLSIRLLCVNTEVRIVYAIKRTEWTIYIYTVSSFTQATLQHIQQCDSHTRAYQIQVLFKRRLFFVFFVIIYNVP